MGSILDRIEQIRAVLNLSQREFAETMGLSQSHYAQILSGRNRLSADHLASLCTNESINANPEWVLKGIGPVFSINDDKFLGSGLMPSQEQVERLYNYVRSRRNVDLDTLQEIKFRLACFKSIKENPNLSSLSDLAIAANIYLNFILKYPDMEL